DRLVALGRALSAAAMSSSSITILVRMMCKIHENIHIVKKVGRVVESPRSSLSLGDTPPFLEWSRILGRDLFHPLKFLEEITENHGPSLFVGSWLFRFLLCFILRP